MAIPSISDAVNVRSAEDLKALFDTKKCIIDDIVVDILSSSSATYDFEITSKPIESGYLNDSRIAAPITLSLDCLFSNAIENLTISGVVQSLISSGTVNFDSWKKKRDHLLKLKDLNKLIEVKTPDKVFKNMMIQNVSAIRNNYDDCFYFSIDFIEVRIKTTAISTDVVVKEDLEKQKDKPTEKRTKKPKAKGKKAPVPKSGWDPEG